MKEFHITIYIKLPRSLVALGSWSKIFHSLNLIGWSAQHHIQSELSSHATYIPSIYSYFSPYVPTVFPSMSPHVLSYAPYPSYVSYLTLMSEMPPRVSYNVALCSLHVTYICLYPCVASYIPLCLLMSLLCPHISLPCHPCPFLHPFPPSMFPCPLLCPFYVPYTSSIDVLLYVPYVQLYVPPMSPLCPLCPPMFLLYPHIPFVLAFVS